MKCFQLRNAKKNEMLSIKECKSRDSISIASNLLFFVKEMNSSHCFEIASIKHAIGEEKIDISSVY